MAWTWYLLLVVSLLTGWLMNDIPGLPGLWVMVLAAAGYAWTTGWQLMGLGTLIAIAAIALIAEVVEFLAGAAGTKKAGGSRRAGWGAILGGVIGAMVLTIPIPVVGTIFGACIGAFIGALVAQFSVRGHAGESLRVGWGAARGRFLGTVSKLAFGGVMFAIAIVAGFPSNRKNLPPPPVTAPATAPSTAPGAS